MKATLTICYAETGIWDVKELSDEVLGAITRAALNKAAVDPSSYKEVNWKVIADDDTGESHGVPF
jgi:hypothetical protein